jgi:hypothetical protein
MGVSISNTPTLPLLVAGTAGLLVHAAKNSSQKFILSNNHVIGAMGPTDCPNTATSGTWTLQPGTFDIGYDPGQDPTFQVGSGITSWPLSTSTSNVIDAALASTNSSFATNTVYGIGQPNARVGLPTVNEAVVKSGRTTGVSLGNIEAVNVTVPNVNYSGCGQYTFVNQLSITNTVAPKALPFSAAGDSGAAILDANTHKPVGLLFAGNARISFANQITSVYTLLKVVPDGGTGVGQSPAVFDVLDDQLDYASDPLFFHTVDVQARHEGELLRVSGVQAVGIGLHENGREFVIKVYVEDLGIAHLLPKQIEGVAVSVEESGGEIRPL